MLLLIVYYIPIIFPILIIIILQGGRAGDAYGFTISSLRKLKDTRANKPRMSLLHYISQICQDQDPSLLSLRANLPHLEKACK